MGVWIVVMIGLVIISYLSDAGVLPFLREVRSSLHVPSLMSILLIVYSLGVLIRVNYMTRKREKESLREALGHHKKRMEELEKEHLKQIEELEKEYLKQIEELEKEPKE